MRRIVPATVAAALALLAAIQFVKWSRADSPGHNPAPSGAPSAERKSADPKGLTASSSNSFVIAPSSDAGYITVHAATVTPRLEAYGQVQPISTLPVNAAEPGVVNDLTVLPGTHVREGQELAHLSGPAIQSALQQSEADVRSAQAQFTAAQKTLAIEREQLPSHLSTRTMVQQSESAVAQAQTNFDNAESHLLSVRQMMTVSAPAKGTVLAINASDGQLVGVAQPVVTLQPASRLWLEASYYGTDLSLIRVGMTGVFSPANGSAPIPVRVRAISGAMTPGEGVMIGLSPAISRAQWFNGEFGMVTLDLPPRKLVAVPTRSLILDRGKWWVLVHTPQGEHPQEVVPATTQGWNTFLESGIRAGSQVVVEDAYLLFHRGISKAYQPPD
jgi:RND family efflux transporter MFP subunit